MVQYTREELINGGIKYGLGYGDVDRALRKYGHSGLTLAEANKLDSFGFKQGWKDFTQNLGNLGAGIPTAISSVIDSASRGKFIDEVVKKLPEGIMSTYNTSPEKLEKYGTSGLGWDILYGAKKHPVEAGIDVLSLGGGKALSAGKAALAESKTLNRLAKSTKATKFLKDALLPTKAQKALRSELGLSSVKAKVKTRNLDKLVGDFERAAAGHLDDLKQATKNVRYGTMEGSELAKDLTKQMHNIVKEQSGTAIKMNLMDSGTHYKNTIAQHITDMGGSAQLHHDSLKIVEKGLKGKLTDPVQKKLFDTAKLAADEGRTSYLSQVIKPTKGLGHAEPVAEGGYFTKERFAGKTAPEVQAEYMPKTFNYVSEQIRRGDVTSSGLKYIVDNFAEKVPISEFKNIYENGIEAGKVLVRQEDLDKVIKGAFGNKNLDKTILELDSTQSIINDLAKAKIPEAVYKIDAEYLKALSNSVKRLRSNKLTNFIKRALLTLPKWVIENRYSNWLNNFIDGVTLKHYGKAFELAEDAPPWLDEMTSYASFTGDPMGTSMRTRKAFKGAIDRTVTAFKNGNISGMVSGINEFFSIPMAAPEAFLEKIDRLANFIKHTEDYAKKVGKPFDEVYNATKTNTKLFQEIYENTNKALGDYVSRNYFLPNELYEVANFVYPFWRFPVESLKVTAHQLANKPFGFQSFAGIPGRVGARKWEETKKKYKLDHDDFTGGVLWKHPADKYKPYSFLSAGTGNQYTALANLFGAATGTDQGSMLGINPILTSAYKWLNLKSNFGTPARLKGTVQIRGKLYDIDEKGNIIGEHDKTGIDMANYALSDMLNTAFVPYRISKNLLRPIYYTATGQPMGSAYVDVLNPFQQGDVYSTQKTHLMEKLGQQVGAPIQYTYPEFKLTPKQKAQLEKMARKKKGR